MISRIQQAVNAAFAQAGDMVQTVTYKHQKPYPDNPPPGYEVEYETFPVRIIKMDYTTTEMANSGGAITLGSKKVLLPVTEIDVTPVASKDSLIIDGKQHTIESVRIKSKALYILRI
jgi:hypothetical protein